MNLEQAQNYICDIQKFAKKNTLAHTKKYLELLGNPCKNAKIIHVAGTNGKGSVCNYLRALLQAHGYRTGMFVSPHLVDMRERILLDGVMVSEEQFLEAFWRVKKVADSVRENGELHHPTFFEFLFLMAMLIFGEESPDYIILETGMGGRLDATNVFEQPVLTVITEIGLDHCQYLGDTKEKIAEEKAGIVKAGIPLVYVKREKSVSEILEKTAERCGNEVFAVDKTRISDVNINDKSIDFSYKSRYYNNVSCTLPTCALYQVENAATALTAFEVLFSGNKIQCVKMQEAIQDAKWPGRMEEIATDIYVDGAHNADGIKAFLDSVAIMETGRKKFLLFSAVSDKEYKDMIRQVETSGLFDTYIVATIEDERGLSGEQIEECFAFDEGKDIYLCESVQDAYEKAVSLKGDGVLFIAGSLYLAGEVKALLKEESK